MGLVERVTLTLRKSLSLKSKFLALIITIIYPNSVAMGENKAADTDILEAVAATP